MCGGGSISRMGGRTICRATFRARCTCHSTTTSATTTSPAAADTRARLPPGPRRKPAARRWGIRQDSLVVVYDAWNRAGSARAWWVLTAAGLSDVRILDGGLAAWRSTRQSIETGLVKPEPGNVTVPHDDLYAGGRLS